MATFAMIQPLENCDCQIIASSCHIIAVVKRNDLVFIVCILFFFNPKMMDFLKITPKSNHSMSIKANQAQWFMCAFTTVIIYLLFVW